MAIFLYKKEEKGKKNKGLGVMSSCSESCEERGEIKSVRVIKS